jgi:competence protein ComEC
LAVLHSSRDSFAVKEWLAGDGDARSVKEPSLQIGVQCDAVGCLGRLADGRLVSDALAAEAFEEDCTRAAVVISAQEAPRACAALMIDRALSLRRAGEGFEISMARPPIEK